MIVVDTNIIAYTLIDGDFTAAARQLYAQDPVWRLPPLWRHEFLNILTISATQGICSPDDANQLWNKAINLFTRCELPVDMTAALSIAIDQEISGYDAQFIALAHALKVPLITQDRKLLKKFPEITYSIENFLQKS